MKRFFVFAFLMVLAACNNEDINTNNNTPQRQYSICEFYPIDIFKPTVMVTGSVKVKHYVLSFDSIGGNSSDFFANKRINDEELNEKGRILADTLDSWHYEYLRWDYSFDSYSDTYFRMMYGGISGKAKVYSSQVFADIPAGEDLSDCFEIASIGRIKYPEMTLINDGKRNKDSRFNEYYQSYSFQEYFTEGLVLNGIDEVISISLSDQYYKFLTNNISFTIVIPVTGLNSNGDETSEVFIAELPTIPAS